MLYRKIDKYARKKLAQHEIRLWTHSISLKNNQSISYVLITFNTELTFVDQQKIFVCVISLLYNTNP